MKISKVLLYVVVMVFFVGAQAMPVMAGMVGTDRMLTEYPAQQDREYLHSSMATDKARSLLQANGLTVEQAQYRIAALTDSEAMILAKKYQQLPAAGDAAVVALAIGAIVIIMELAGITDISAAF